MVLLGLAGASVAVALFFPLNDPRLMLNPNFATRYFFFTMVFVIVTMLAMVERGRWWRWVALPGLTLALVLGVREDFRITPAPDTRWPDQIAAFRSLGPGANFFIPVYPQPSEWGLTLRKKEHAVDTRVLDRYPISGGKASIRLDRIRTTLPPESSSPDQKVIFTGTPPIAPTACRREGCS